jgi:WD40 repeat protein
VLRIFISHKSEDSRAAVALKQWLAEQRPELADEIFLDIDPNTGLELGWEWKEQLVLRNSLCEWLICLVSPGWIASRECLMEYHFADRSGKRILIVQLEELTEDDWVEGGHPKGDFTSAWQRCDLFAAGDQTAIEVGARPPVLVAGPPVKFNTAALYQIRRAIEGTGIGPDNFRWPPSDDPKRAPYRGWEPFEDIDAGVFYGRDGAIASGVARLRGMRFPSPERFASPERVAGPEPEGVAAPQPDVVEGPESIRGPESMFVVLGPSGSGKSSFLRAGLVPRLKRDDRNFLVLGVMRAGHALTGDSGFVAAVDHARRALRMPSPTLDEIEEACLRGDADQLVVWLRDLRAAAARRLDHPGTAPDGQRGPDSSQNSAPTLVLPLDQAEEVFPADPTTQGARFVKLAADLLGRINATDVGLIVAATIRTDRYAMMQTDPALRGIGTVLFNELKPMPREEFNDVITGPARRATEGGDPLTIDVDLRQQLIADAQGPDTLPLLALTLDRLYQRYAKGGKFTLSQYTRMGGMRQIVNKEIEQILPVDPQQRETALAQLRSAFIPGLVTINPDNNQPMRRAAPASLLPESAMPLIDALVERRLLVRDRDEGKDQVVVEVALESLFAHWAELKSWLDEQREDIKTADDIKRSAAGWETAHRNPDWLLTRTRLEDAELLSNTTQFAKDLAGARGFLAASRQAENERLAAEEQHRQEKLAAEEQQRQEQVRHAEEVARLAQDRQQAAEALAAAEVEARENAEALAAAETEAREQAQEHAVVLRGRSRVLKVVLAVAVIAALVAGAGFVFAMVERQNATARARQAIAERLGSESVAMLNGDRPGGTVRAIQEMTAALSLKAADLNTDAVSAALKLIDTQKVIPAAGLVSSVAVSPDGRRMAAGNANGDYAVRVWDTGTGQPAFPPMKGHKDNVLSVAFSPDGTKIVSGSADKSLRVWDAEKGQPLGEPFTGHERAVTSVAYSPDRKIVSGSKDRTIRIWDAGTGRQIGAPLQGHTEEVTSVSVSPDGTKIVSGSADKSLRIWDASTRQPIGDPLFGHDDTVTSVAFSPGGERIVSGSSDKKIRVWDTDHRQAVGDPLVGHTAEVKSVAFGANGRRIVSGSVDDTVRIWDADTGQPVGAPLRGHTQVVWAVKFSPDSSRVVSGSSDGTIREWEMQSTVPVSSDPGQVLSVAFSPDSGRVVSGSGDGTLQLWDTATRKPTGGPMSGTGSVVSVAVSPDGTRIAAGSTDGTIQIWDAQSGTPIGAPLTGHKGTVWSVAFSLDSHRLASGGEDGIIRLWDAQANSPIGAPLVGQSAVDSVAFSPDGHRLVSGGDDTDVRIWDADSGHPIGKPLKGHNNRVRAVAFTPDGHKIVSCSYDSTLRLWDADQQKPIGEAWNGHTGPVLSLAVTPDGQRVVSSSYDTTVRLWDITTGQQIGAPLNGHTDFVPGVAVSPDSRQIASGSFDRTVRIWPFPTASLDSLCGKINANMSPRQWQDWVPGIDYVKACPNLPVAADDTG